MKICPFFCNYLKNISYNCIMIESRTYYDCINDTTIEFHSNASQKLITGLEFNGEWHVVREMLFNFGYTVLENYSKN